MNPYDITTIECRIRELEQANRRVDLKCKRLHPDAVLPAKAGPLEVGWDICCVADDEFIEICDSCDNASDYSRVDFIHHYGISAEVGDKFLILRHGISHLFRTGIACAIDPGYAMLYWDRSGMGAKKNIHVLAGAIDCTYRGEWMVSLINLSERVRVIKSGDKIVQGILTKVIPGEAKWHDNLPESYRGENGFGSTGN